MSGKARFEKNGQSSRSPSTGSSRSGRVSGLDTLLTPHLYSRAYWTYGSRRSSAEGAYAEEACVFGDARFE